MSTPTIQDVGIGVVAQLEQFREDMAQIPGITAEEAKLMHKELVKAVKASEAASKAAKKAAEEAEGQLQGASRAAGEAAENTESFADRAGDAGSASGKLGQALGVLSPSMGEVGSTIADLADGFEVVGQLADGVEGGMLRVAAITGPLAATFAALTVAYSVNAREAERVAHIQEFQHEVAMSLQDSTRELEDSQIDLAVATGAMTDLQGKHARIDLLATRAVLDYAEALVEQKKQLHEASEATSLFLKFQRGAIAFVSAFGMAHRLAYGDFGEATRQAIARTTELVDSVTGQEQALRDARAELDQLAKAELEHQQLVKKNADHLHELTEAEARQTAASAGARDAERAAVEEKRRLAEAAAKAAAEIETQADAQRRLQAILASAEAPLLTEEERLLRARAEALVEFEAAAEASALTEVEIARARAQLLQAFDDQVAEHRESLAEAAARADMERLQKLDELQQDTISRFLEAGSSALRTASSAMASANDALRQSLEDNAASLTEAERAQIEARIRQNKKLGMAAFRANQASAVAQAAMTAIAMAQNAYNAALQLGPAGLVLAPIAAAAAGAVGAAQLLDIANTSPPKFHRGRAPDEIPATLTRTEGVLTGPAVSKVGGPQAVRDLNRGASAAPAPVVALVQLGHRVFDAAATDNLRAGGALQRAVTRAQRRARRRASSAGG